MGSSDERPASLSEGYQLDSILRIKPLEQHSSSSSSHSSDHSSTEQYCRDSILRIVPPSQNEPAALPPTPSSPSQLLDPSSNQKRARPSSPFTTSIVPDGSCSSSSDLSSSSSQSPFEKSFPKSTDNFIAQPKPLPARKPNDNVSYQQERISDSSLRLSHILTHGFNNDLGYAVLRVKPAGVALHGISWLSVISGAVQVCGAVLFPTSSPILFHSSFRPLLVVPYGEGDLSSNCVKSGGSLNLMPVEHPDTAPHMSLRQEMRGSFSKLKADEPLILVTEVSRTSSAPPLCSDLPHTDVRYGINNVPSAYAEPINFLRIYESSMGQAINVPEFVKKHGLPARLLITGPHNAGKSTLARAVVNYYITSERVKLTRASCVYVDVDVGLPDRSVAGIVAAHVVTDPSTSRRSACRSVPLSARYFADVTPRENPTLYAQCVQAVLSDARTYADINGLPMVVNSHGWTTGAGEKLIAELCARVDPIVVMRVRGGTSPRTAALADFALNRVLSSAPSGTQIVEVPGRPSYLPIDRSLPNAAQERDLVLCAYFAQELAVGRTRRVRVRDIHIVVAANSEDVEVLNHTVPAQALISTTVALARTVIPHETFKGIAGAEQEASHDPFSVHCLDVRGMALVRGIDDTGEWLFVATPLPTDVLQTCSVAILGFGVQTPFLLISDRGLQYRDTNQKGHQATPFWMLGCIDTGGGTRIRKSQRRNGIRYR